MTESPATPTCRPLKRKRSDSGSETKSKRVGIASSGLSTQTTMAGFGVAVHVKTAAGGRVEKSLLVSAPMEDVIQPFQCSYCGDRFQKSNTLASHISAKHFLRVQEEAREKKKVELRSAVVCPLSFFNISPSMLAGLCGPGAPCLPKAMYNQVLYVLGTALPWPPSTVQGALVARRSLGYSCTSRSRSRRSL